MQSVVRHQSQALVASNAANGRGAVVKKSAEGPARTSHLAAPILHLAGHQGDVTAVQFSPGDGRWLASASADQTIGIWKVFPGDGEDDNRDETEETSCRQALVIGGGAHRGAVLDIKWMPSSSADSGPHLVSASADHTLCLWDVERMGERVRRWKGHQAFVQTLSVVQQAPGTHQGGPMTGVIASGADDGYIKLWDPREKYAVATIQHPWPVTALAFSAVGDVLFTGSIDNVITPYDVRQLSTTTDSDDGSTVKLSSTLPVLKGHSDTITCLRLSPDGTRLMSNAQDNTVRVWDVKPFSAVPGRQSQVLQGATHGFDRNLIRGAWSPDGSQIACGSADRTVCVWDVASAKLLYKLPGHKGTVNDVDWHPKEPVLASGSVDKTIFLGEINPPGSEFSYRIE